MFGEVVEAAGAPEHLAKVCTEALAVAVPGIITQVTTHIDRGLAHLELRQRVNLDVRAKKRRALCNPPPIARYVFQSTGPDTFTRYLKATPLDGLKSDPPSQLGRPRAMTCLARL